MEWTLVLRCTVLLLLFEETLAESLTRRLVETKDVQNALAPVGSVMCVVG